MRFWLMKTEPDVFSIDTLEKMQRSPWDGVRNYQARNYMRDEMKPGEIVIIYHSNAKPPGIAGFATVDSEPYADPTQFITSSEYFDPKATAEKPRWQLIDVKYLAHSKGFLPLEWLKDQSELTALPLLQKGQRLSIQPVDKESMEFICRAAGLSLTALKKLAKSV